MKLLSLPIAIAVLAATAASAGDALRPADAAAEVTPAGRSLVLASLRIADERWDERASLLWNKGTRDASSTHNVRQSAWYTLGLMLRDAPGDRNRAVNAVRAVLAQQIDEPDAVWNGTFFRSAEEKQPRHDARIWQDYDPNWRQFIGCSLAQLLLAFDDRLPADLHPRIDDAIRRAVEGELGHGRLRPTYTNIALMHGFLLSFAGERLHRPEWVRDGEAWIARIASAFAQHQSFDEYNSPTYYGVDLYGLALLRHHGATPRLRELGASMEAALWNDIARFYHAGLQNLAGPYDRAYGMDLRSYVSLVGVWLGLVLPEKSVPLPPLTPSMKQGHDFLTIPCYALLGVRMPEEAKAHFTQFAGERRVSRPIAEGRRVATAWLDHNIMLGAEETDLSRDVRSPDSQFRPATIHWRASDDTVGWAAVIQSSRINARADRHLLTIEAIGDCTLRIHVEGVATSRFTRESWSLPGLHVNVETDALGFSVQPGAGSIDVTYTQATHVRLRTELTHPEASR